MSLEAKRYVFFVICCLLFLGFILSFLEYDRIDRELMRLDKQKLIRLKR
jgi:hypothetical protein